MNEIDDFAGHVQVVPGDTVEREPVATGIEQEV
jgi:hypothetical protein